MKDRSLLNHIRIYCNNKLIPILYTTTILSGLNLFLGNPQEKKLYSFAVFIPSLLLSHFLARKELKEYSGIEYICKSRGFQNFMFEKKGLERNARLYAKINKEMPKFNKAKHEYQTFLEVNAFK